MYYFRCPTCRTEFANRLLIWEKELEKICNSTMTRKEKDAAQGKLLDSLNLRNICCRMRFVTYTDTNKIVK